jgi:hypothetical protein
MAWVGDLGEGVEQITALLSCQRSGFMEPMGNTRMMEGRHGLPVW